MPSGLVVTCQNERSQIQNKEQAMKVLKSRLYELQENERLEKEGNERRSKIGTGDRAEKIRTYNYPQNRVTDHRIGYTTNTLDRVMDGALDDIIDALIQEDPKRKLQGEVIRSDNMTIEELLVFGKSHCHSDHAKILLAELLNKNSLELLNYLDEQGR